MENATKALLIAAAILVAILIISLGLAVYNKAANATDSADLSQAQVQSYNEKFLKYEGTSKRGSEVNALLETVLNHNMTVADKSQQIAVTGTISLKVSDTSIGTRAATSKLYTIKCTRDGKSGLVTSITVSDNSSSGGSGSTGTK